MLMCGCSLYDENRNTENDDSRIHMLSVNMKLRHRAMTLGAQLLSARGH